MASLQYYFPERLALKRAHFVHIALPGSLWSLCQRARVGDEAIRWDYGLWEVCPRCETRKRFIERGEPVRRHRR
jgi:hypothetical protein